MKENYYEQFAPVVKKMDELLEMGPAVVAIDGGSGSGKSTLAEYLQEKYDCTVFHMDDFFLRPEQRTCERCEEIGGNIDRERFLEEVLIPLRKKQQVYYRRFDCSTFEFEEAVPVYPKKLTIVEGVYSMHPDLAEYYDFSVFLEVEPKVQRERIKKRNSVKKVERYYSEWIPLENVYFKEMHVKDRCEMSISITD